MADSLRVGLLAQNGLVGHILVLLGLDDLQHKKSKGGKRVVMNLITFAK